MAEAVNKDFHNSYCVVGRFVVTGTRFAWSLHHDLARSCLSGGWSENDPWLTYL